MLTGVAENLPGIGHPTVLAGQDAARLPELHQITGVDVAHQAGLLGAGQTVVVIDSGVAYDHPALGGGLGTSYRVVGGWDFTEENDADPYDDGPAGYHGTHVAGILAGEDLQHRGVAPEADIVALRVFNDQGRGKLSWLETSLQWVIENQHAFEHPITTVNLSIGTSWHDVGLPDYAKLEDELEALRDAQIFVSVAAGNRFDTDDPLANHVGLSYPAVSPHVVPAASSNGQGELSHFSQRHPTSLVVPGEKVTSTVPDFLEDFNGKPDDFYAASGTSMAAPYLAGASMLVRQAMQLAGKQQITVDQIYDVLARTADRNTDVHTGETYLHVNVGNAVRSLLPQPVDLPIQPVPQNTPVTGPEEQQSDEPSAPLHFAGTTLTIEGTDGDDRIHVDPHGFVRVNGIRYAMSIDAINAIRINGNSGQDHLTMDVRQPNSELMMRPNEVRWKASSLSLDAAGFERIDVLANSTGTTAEFHGGSGRDHVSIEPDRSWMRGGNSVSYVHHASNVTAFAGDELDTITMIDGPGDDFAEITSDFASLQSDNFSATARGYASYVLRAHNGGHDVVTLVGTTQDDRVRARPEYVTLHSPSHSVFAAGFERRHVEGQGGRDQARLYGSSAADQLNTTYQHDVLVTPTSEIELHDFARVEAVGGDGFDSVVYTGSNQSDAFSVYPDLSRAIIADTVRSTREFESTTIDALSGQDSAVVYDSTGDDQFQLATEAIHVEGPGFEVQVSNVEFTQAISQHGRDQAILLVSETADRVLSKPESVVVRSANELLLVDGFASVETRQLSDELLSDLWKDDEEATLAPLAENLAAQKALGNTT